jgi:hypothetical protein
VNQQIEINHRKSLLTDGYTIVKNVFSRSELNDFSNAAVSYELGDLLSYPDFVGFVLDTRVLEVVSQIMGCVPIYFGDSGALVGARPRGYHRDIKAQEAAEMDGWILRAALYVRPSGRTSGGLKVVPKSHRTSSALLRSTFLSCNLSPDEGDVIIWDMRIIHSGSALRTPLINLSIPPWLEDFFDPMGPRKHTDRLVLLTTFTDGGPLHEKYCQERASSCMREHWLNSFRWSHRTMSKLAQVPIQLDHRFKDIRLF